MIPFFTATIALITSCSFQQPNSDSIDSYINSVPQDNSYVSASPSTESIIVTEGDSSEEISENDIFESNTTIVTAEEEPQICDYIMFAKNKSNLRAERNNSSEIICVIDKNDSINVIEIYNDGWCKAIYDEKTVYVMQDNLTLEEPTIETTQSVVVQTESQPITTAPIVTTTATEKDNSAEIIIIQEQISLCEEQNTLYEQSIDECNMYIDDLENLLSSLESELETAKAELEKSKKKKVFVYKEGQGLVQVTDESAVEQAQQNVDDFKSLISECKSEIKSLKKSIEEYEVMIQANNSSIEVYKEEIKSLS